MIPLHYCDDGDLRPQAQERMIIFISLNDKNIALPGGGVGAQLGDVAADDEGRVQTGLMQDEGNHGCRRRFAVGAGDGHALLMRHHVSQPLGPLDDGDPSPVGFFYLWIVGGHGGRDDDQVSLAQIGGGVADVNSRSQPGQPFGGR